MTIFTRIWVLGSILGVFSLNAAQAAGVKCNSASLSEAVVAYKLSYDRASESDRNSFRDCVIQAAHGSSEHVNNSNGVEGSALEAASYHADAKLVRALIQEGADPTLNKGQGYPIALVFKHAKDPASNAVSAAQINDTLNALIKNNGHYKISSELLTKALFTAVTPVSQGDKQYNAVYFDANVIQTLVDAGADVNANREKVKILDWVDQSCEIAGENRDSSVIGTCVAAKKALIDKGASRWGTMDTFKSIFAGNHSCPTDEKN